ncbi:MAG: GGDEF domain-containing protein, partial [Longimicrobiales bacterium]
LAPGALIALLLATLRARVAPWLTFELIDVRLTAWTHLPQLALLTAGIAVPTVALLAVRGRRSTDAGLAWMILATLFALAAPTGSVARGVWVLAAGVILVIALIEASYVMAFHDELTELPGRRALNQMLASVRAPYTLAVIDVDRFKSFNDRYGHDVGDQVLRMVASKLAGVGGGGRAFRSGGEEFTIVFPGRAKPEALPHVQAVREAVENARFSVRSLPRPRGRKATAARGMKGGGARQLGVTISAGLASFGTASTSAQSVLKSADKAMYRAKKNGRNRVVA